MRESMLGKIVSLVVIASDEILRTLVDLLEKLLYGEGKGEFFTQFKKFLRKEECWVTKNTSGVVVNTLQFVGEREFPGVTRFVVPDNFVVDMRVGAKVKIAHLTRNFRRLFLHKTVELDIPASKLVHVDLTENSLDEIIIQFLGGEEKAEVSLAEVFYQMSLQRDGEEGDLLTNGWENIFYVRDADGVLLHVHIFWRDGWLADADLNSCYRIAGGRVFSRKQVASK